MQLNISNLKDFPKLQPIHQTSSTLCPLISSYNSNIQLIRKITKPLKMKRFFIQYFLLFSTSEAPKVLERITKMQWNQLKYPINLRCIFYFFSPITNYSHIKVYMGKSCIYVCRREVLDSYSTYTKLIKLHLIFYSFFLLTILKINFLFTELSTAKIDVNNFQ